MSDRKQEMGRLADRASRKRDESDEDPDDEASNTTETSDDSAESSTSRVDPSEETPEGCPDEAPDEDPPTDASDDTTDPDDDDGPETETVRHVKDRPSVYMYLPKEFGKNLDIACQMINLTYQRETGDKLPKNRYLYPIVTKVGYENAGDLSFEEIQALKEEIDEIDVDETET